MKLPKIEKALIVDVETTGTDKENDRCIEVAATLFHCGLGAPIESYASVIYAEENPAQQINKIDPALLKHARNTKRTWNVIWRLMERADVCVAHRASFDRAFVWRGMREHLDADSNVIQPNWCCTKFDVIFPGCKPGDGLVHVALGLGLGVAHAHRAMSDVDTLCRILARMHEMGHDVGEFLAMGLRPKARYVSCQEYKDNQRAKDLGFRWSDKDKEWYRNIAIEDGDAMKFPFKVIKKPYREED